MVDEGVWGTTDTNDIKIVIVIVMRRRNI